MSESSRKSGDSSKASTDTLEQQLSERIPATDVPGFWDALADNSVQWAGEVTACPFWVAVVDCRDTWLNEYRRMGKGELFAYSTTPSFSGKSAERIREKTLEKIKEAKQQGDDDPIGAVFDSVAPVPRLSDLVRTRIQCNFLDGVPYLANKMLALANQTAHDAELQPKGELAGYFAQHLTFRTSVHFRFGGKEQSYRVTCEVQIATVLGTQVWERSHDTYESSRVDTNERPEDWQWNPHDPRFLSRQLGHMIHLADGVFCLLRDTEPRGSGKN